MRSASMGIIMVGTVALAACPPKVREPISVAIICTAASLDSAGVAVGSLTDTVRVEILGDSVATDPRPCRSSYQRTSGTITLNGRSATDSVSGDPRD